MSTHRHATVLSIAALGLCLGAAPVGYQLAWLPEEGAQLERHLELQLGIEFRSGGMTVNGLTMPLEEVYPGFDAAATGRDLSLDLTVADRVQSVQLGRAVLLERDYESIAVNGRTDDDGPETARFAWDRRTGRYVAEAVDEDLDAATAELVSEILREDLDCRWLLPDGDVEKASVWNRELDPQQALELVGFPGMDAVELLRKGIEEGEEDPDIVASLAGVLDQLDGAPKAGSVAAEMVGTRVVDGQTIALVELTIDLELHMDFTEFMVTAFERRSPAESDGVTPEHVRAKVIVSGEGEGQLEWNVSAGRMHSIETSVDYLFEISAGFDMLVEEHELPITGWGSWGGTLTSRRDVSLR